MLLGRLLSHSFYLLKCLLELNFYLVYATGLHLFCYHLFDVYIYLFGQYRYDLMFKEVFLNDLGI